MALGMRADFFFATSALVELPTLAPRVPGLQSPTDLVAAGSFCSSVFLGFDRPTAFTALCVFSGCAGCRGGPSPCSGNVVAASWTFISASSYGRRFQLNMHGLALPSNHMATHLTSCAETSNNYENTSINEYTMRRIAKIQYKSAKRSCAVAGCLNKCLPRCQSGFKAFQDMLEGMFPATTTG